MVTDAKEKADIIASCNHTLELSDRNACDIELLATGGFSPLNGTGFDPFHSKFCVCVCVLCSLDVTGSRVT